MKWGRRLGGTHFCAKGWHLYQRGWGASLRARRERSVAFRRPPQPRVKGGVADMERIRPSVLSGRCFGWACALWLAGAARSERRALPKTNRYAVEQRRILSCTRPGMVSKNKVSPYSEVFGDKKSGLAGANPLSEQAKVANYTRSGLFRIVPGGRLALVRLLRESDRRCLWAPPLCRFQNPPARARATSYTTGIGCWSSSRTSARAGRYSTKSGP